MNHRAFSKSLRCDFRTPSGRRCRQPASGPDSDFCANHATVAENHQEAADLAATLTGGLAEFKSPAAINDFLSRLLLLLAQNRISPRRAAVLAYITNQLLRTLSAIEKEAADHNAKKIEPRIIWDLPRPEREHRDPA